MNKLTVGWIAIEAVILAALTGANWAIVAQTQTANPSAAQDQTVAPPEAKPLPPDQNAAPGREVKPPRKMIPGEQPPSHTTPPQDPANTPREAPLPPAQDSLTPLDNQAPTPDPKDKTAPPAVVPTQDQTPPPPNDGPK